MTKMNNEQLERLNKNGYKVIRLNKSYALVRNYSIHSKSKFKKHISFYGLIKINN